MLNTMKPTLDESILLDEDLSNNYEPDESEIRDYAVYLGMKLPEDNDLLYLAREGLKAPLPPGWKAHRSKEDEIFYLNDSTGQKTWEHPCDDFYRNQYLQMKALKSRTSGKREEQKHQKQFQMQQKMLGSNMQIAAGGSRPITATHTAENSSAVSLNYSANLTNFGDHSLFINQYNRGNDSTVINGSPVIAAHGRTPSPISEKKESGRQNFLNSDDSQKILHEGDELGSLSKCEFDEFKELDQEDELNELNAARSDFGQDELEIIPSRDENRSRLGAGGHISEHDEESLNLSEFNLDFDPKSRRDVYSKRTHKAQISQRQHSVDSYRQVDFQIKLQKELELIDKEYEMQWAVFNEELDSKLEQFKKEKDEIFESEKLRMNENFQEELERIKQEIENSNNFREEDDEPGYEADSLETERLAALKSTFENAKKAIKAEFSKKEQELEAFIEDTIQERIEESDRSIATGQLRKKEEVQREIETLQQKLKDLCARKDAQTEKLTRLLNEHEADRNDIILTTEKKVKDFERIHAVQREQELCSHKRELNEKLDHQRMLAAAEKRQLEEEISWRCKDLHDKFSEDHELDKQRMVKEIEAELNKYYESEHSKILEQLSARTDSQKSSDIKRKINALEVEQVVYEQSLKRKLEEIRCKEKLNLNKQIELVDEQGTAKELQREKSLSEIKYQIEEKRSLEKLIRDANEQYLQLQRTALEKEEKEVALFEQIQELSEKIAEKELQLNALKNQMSTPKSSELNAVRKKDLVLSIDNLQKTLDSRDKEILSVKARASTINVNDSFTNQNQSISFILKEIESIKQTIKNQNNRIYVPKPRGINRSNIHNRTFLLNNTIDYVGNSSQNRFNSSDGFENSESNEEEGAYSEDENNDEYGLRENAIYPKKKQAERVRRDLSYEQIKLNQMPPRGDSSSHTRSLQPHLMSKTLTESDKSLRRTSGSSFQLKMQLWRERINRETEALEFLNGGMKERKLRIKRMQDNLREEQERYKVENAAFKENPIKFHGRKAKLEAFKSSLNENIKHYNDDLMKLREDEKIFKEKKQLLTTISMTVDSYEKKACWNELELNSYYSKYQDLRLNTEVNAEGQMKTIEVTKPAQEEDDIENRENIDVNIVEKKPVQSLKSIRNSNSKGILKMPSGRLPLREAEDESLRPTREVERTNKSFEHKNKPAMLTNNASGLDSYKFSSLTAGVKRSILLNQQSESPQQQQLSVKNTNSLVPRNMAQTLKFEAQNDRQHRLYDNLISKYYAK